MPMRPTKSVEPPSWLLIESRCNADARAPRWTGGTPDTRDRAARRVTGTSRRGTARDSRARNLRRRQFLASVRGLSRAAVCHHRPIDIERRSALSPYGRLRPLPRNQKEICRRDAKESGRVCATASTTAAIRAITLADLAELWSGSRSVADGRQDTRISTESRVAAGGSF